MLKIRKEQEEALAEVVRKTFAERAHKHLAKTWPDECAEIGEEHVREMVDDGIRSAAEHDITMDADVLGFIELYILLGPDFETSPDTPWAAEILNNETLDGELKVYQLRHRASKELDRIIDSERIGQ